MLEIEFTTEPRAQDLELAADEYRSIWEGYGTRMREAWEKASGFQFKDEIINALVKNEYSRAYPMILRADLPYKRKQTVLTHELGHRLLRGTVEAMAHADSLLRHKFLYLVIDEVLMKVFGNQAVDEARALDFEIGGAYATARNWIDLLNFEERRKKYLEVCSGDLTPLAE